MCVWLSIPEIYYDNRQYDHHHRRQYMTRQQQKHKILISLFARPSTVTQVHLFSSEYNLTPRAHILSDFSFHAQPLLISFHPIGQYFPQSKKFTYHHFQY